MHKVEELEQRWFNYKIKKIIIPAIKISSLYVLFSASYYVYDNKDAMFFSLLPSSGMTNVLGVSIDANKSVVMKEQSIKEVIIPQKEPIPEKEEVKIVEKIILSPIIPVIDMEKEERISSVKQVKHVVRTKPVKEKNTVRAKKNDYLTAKELAVITKSKKSNVVAPRKTKKMNFTSTSNNYLEMMKHKFSKSNTPRDALLVAKSYYNSAEYAKAEKWALSANKLDNSLEDSWLLFAKSKVKLGKKKEALKILVSYYKKSQSRKAKRLIGQIQTGRI